MYILGLNIGHNSTACLLKDGKILSCVSEERFTRIKNQSGVPLKSIEYLFKEEKIEINKINLMVLDDHYPVKLNDTSFAERFLEDYTKKGFKRKLFSKAGYKWPGLFQSFLNLRGKKDSPINKSKLAKILGCPKNKIKTIDHHFAHALTPCFNLPKNKKTLIFTLDGEGSGLCATVSIFDGKQIKRISESKRTASIGYLYAITTIYLGMKPLQHEFKVMGIAPYAKQHSIDQIYGKFRDLFWINNSLEFKSKFSIPFSDIFFQRELPFVRFDTMAGAVQRLTEDLTAEWVRKAIKKTGIKNIALSGGVFMNVKVNQKILEMPEVKSLFVVPSCGDESNAIGACYYGYHLYCQTNNKKSNPKPIKDLYLGPGYDDKYIENLISQHNLKNLYKIKKTKDINKEIAKLLSKNEIVARCSGRSEWGARALGNRSILANPNSPETIKILNELIKNRDFWMPFTPSILDKFEKKYIINPKKMPAPYMVTTFKSTELSRKNLPAAMHPYDTTIRPQIVYKSWNPDYYEIISEFSKLTGTGAILNTSFNLHGEPNVLTPEDALHTVENSELKYLALNNYLFEKR